MPGRGSWVFSRLGGQLSGRDGNDGDGSILDEANRERDALAGPDITKGA